MDKLASGQCSLESQMAALECKESGSGDEKAVNGDSASLEDIVCVEDFEELAKLKLEKSTYDYIFWGADENKTLEMNRWMISRSYCLIPRVLCDVGEVDLTTYVFGDRLSMPIGISPSAMHKMVHASGELAMVGACNETGALMIHSIFSNTSLKDVALAAPLCTKWQNIYIFKDRQLMQRNVDLAIQYGFRGLVVTCDAPVLGHRRRDLKNKFKINTEETCLENLKDSQSVSLREHSSDIFDPTVSWQELAELKKSVGDTIRVVVKGIMCPEDAQLALEAGVDGIFVSNHGGRQLDRAPATIQVLPAIVRAVNGRCPVFVDGGFRTGADILIALALGADMVFVGRPPLFGLACFGEPGVRHCLELLRNELTRAMKLCGCRSLAQVKSGKLLMQDSPVARGC